MPKRFSKGATWLAVAGALLVASASAIADVDPDNYGIRLGTKKAEEIVKLIGEPAARYFVESREYWLYEVTFAERDGRRVWPELIVKGGKYQQTNYWPEATMKKSIAIVKSFGDFRPVADPQVKRFGLADTRIVGATKADAVAKLGPPDVKRVFNGIEIWGYLKVPADAGGQNLITIHVEFEDDKVKQTVGG